MSLKQIAVDNAKSVAPDIRVVKEEYRNVNGLDLLLLEMHGTVQGKRFAYYGYYYSIEEGTVQLVSYTSQNMIKKSIPVLEDFLNGLVMIDQSTH